MNRYEKVQKPRRMVRGYRGLREYLPLGESQLRQAVADGRIKAPMELGPRAVAWFEDDVVEMQNNLKRK